MSTCANFFVLFREPPTPERLKEVEAIIANRTNGVIAPRNHQPDYERLTAVEDADLVADVNEDGSLHYLNRQRYSPLIGAPSIQGRLHVLQTLMRLWADWYPEGPAVEYVVLTLSLLAQDDVIGVWYGDEKYQDGGTIPPMTKAAAYQMLDDFIRIGRRNT